MQSLGDSDNWSLKLFCLGASYVCKWDESLVWFLFCQFWWEPCLRQTRRGRKEARRPARKGLVSFLGQSTTRWAICHAEKRHTWPRLSANSSGFGDGVIILRRCFSDRAGSPDPALSGHQVLSEPRPPGEGTGPTTCRCQPIAHRGLGSGIYRAATRSADPSAMMQAPASRRAKWVSPKKAHPKNTLSTADN